MKKEYDLTIAGAGPAGLMAAVTAAQEGLAVALIERKTEISSIKRSQAQKYLYYYNTSVWSN